MSEKFIRFRRRAFIIRLTRSIAAGLFFGLTAAGVLLLLASFEVIALGTLPIAAIAAGAAILTGAAVFLLLHSSDRALAGRLDREFGLNERTQTMLAFRDEAGTIHELQRADAEEKLAALPTSALRFKHLWACVLAVLIGAATLTAGLILKPAPTPPEPVVDVPFEISAIQIAGLEELISYVDGSEMDSPYRENVVLSLRALLADLKTAKTERERDLALSISLNTIYSETDLSSSTVEMINGMWPVATEETKALVKALNSYTWTPGIEWDDFEEAMLLYRACFAHSDEGLDSPDEGKMRLETANLLASAGTNLLRAVNASGVSHEDALYLVLLRLEAENGQGEGGILGLTALAEQSEKLGYAALKAELDETVETMNRAIFGVLENMAENVSIGEYAMTRLGELFGCKIPAFKRPMLLGSGSQGGGDGGTGPDDNPDSTGGIGTGAVFGSNDLVLDPATGKYVEYGKILDTYYALVFGKLENGDYTEEERDAIKKYFEILYNGFEKEE